MVLGGGGETLGSSVTPTGISGSEAAAGVLDEALIRSGRGREDVRIVVATGYGRELVTFAESEVVGLLARGTPREEIARGLHRGVAERVGNMAKRVGLRGAVYLSGGVAFNPTVVAFNPTVVASLSDFLGREVAVIADPQLNGAFGAALVALEGA